MYLEESHVQVTDSDYCFEIVWIFLELFYQRIKMSEV